MKNHKLLVALFLIAVSSARAQYDYESTDYIDDEPIQGSGDGVLDEPIEVTTEVSVMPVVDDTDSIAPEIEDKSKLCPEVCTCSSELDNGAVKIIVDCSSKGLTEIPTNIDSKTTVLNIEDNNIAVIPKSIADLKSLKELIANDNSIREFAAGSISELPQLKSLKLSNNRLLEFPQELKNGFSLTDLEEIDISGNDIRSEFTVESFSNFKSLRKLILPNGDQTFANLMCDTYKDTLEFVCTGPCDTSMKECPNAPEQIGDAFLEASNELRKISLTSTLPDVDPIKGIVESSYLSNQETSTDTTTIDDEVLPETPVETDEYTDNGSLTEPTSEGTPALRSAIVKDSASLNDVAVDDASNRSTEVKVGATTTSGPSGPMDKSIVGIVVAVMVLIVAGITIQKNWSSLKKRFSSTPRPASERNGTNGISPEEVPLKEKDKSPV